jgi:hypothetical protein
LSVLGCFGIIAVSRETSKRRITVATQTTELARFDLKE